MEGLPRRADVVVIGGGVVGASVAYHLAALGCRDVVLLERAKIGSGTTWHAGGNMETYRADPLLGDMVAYTVDLFPALEAETGVSFGWRQTGRVHFTSSAEMFAIYRSVPARSRARGVVVELLDPREVVERLPVISGDGLRGGLWIPNDGRVDPTNLAMAYARGAKLRGARVVEDVAVERIVAKGGRIAGVETDQGPIRTDAIVLAAGLWSTALAMGLDIRLPLVALHHFYILTKPIAGVPRDLPLYLSYDERIWGREDVGGLIVGIFDANAIPIEPHELPAKFAFSLLPENWAQVDPNMKVVMRRFPLLESAPIRALVNGPESFTPDGEMLLGEVPGLIGLHLCTGMNSNGIALAAGAGRATAERVVAGRSSLDVTKLDVRRFMPFEGGTRYRHRRMSELFEVVCAPPHPARGFTRTRMIRRGPLHAQHQARGAVFHGLAGFERPAWFGGRDDWAAAVARELCVARDAVAVVDRGGDAAILVDGRDARRLLERATGARDIARPGAVTLAPLLDDHGGFEALSLVLALAVDRFLLMAEPGDAVRLERALLDARTPRDRAAVVDVSAGWTAFDLFGPATGTVLARVSDGVGVPNEGSVAAADLGFAPGYIAGLPGMAAHRLLVPTDFAGAVGEALLDGATPAGVLAAEALRIRAGVPRFGAEATSGIGVVAAGLDGGLDLARDFRGKAAVVADNARRPGRRIGRFTVPTEEPGALTEEPVLAGGRMVGYVTSSASIPVGGAVDVFALVDVDARRPAVLVAGRPVALAPMAR